MPRFAAALVCSAVAACSSAQAPATPHTWRVPDGWKHERIPFPLEFAPSLAHRGVEELRFPPGFLDAGAPNAWSYTFVWRLDDAAALDADTLADELAVYFRGLLASVDGDKHRLDPKQIAVTARAEGDRFELTAHVIDTFHAAAPIDLIGSAIRDVCGSGALWTFVLAPAGSPVRAQLDDLANSTACDQQPVP